MPVTTKLRYLRIAPRKVRLVADLIRGKSAQEAQTILKFTTKKAASPLLKLLNSSLLSAKNDDQLRDAILYISKITVDEGPKYKRWMPRARGQAYEIQKKTSHITLVLDKLIEKSEREKSSSMAGSQIKVKEAKTEKTESAIQKTTKENKPSANVPKPKPVVETPKPKIEKGIIKRFRRKAF